VESTLIGLLPLALVVVIGYLIFLKFTKDAATGNARPDGLTPYGIHGWLRFFIFSSYFLAPLFALGRTSNELRAAEERAPQLLTLDGWSQYKTASWILLICIVGWQWWAAYGLRNRLEPKSVFHIKVLLIAAPFAAFIDLFFAQLFLNVQANAELIGSTIGGFVGASIVSLVWFFYFTRSVRVRNTYGTWPITPPQKPAAQPFENLRGRSSVSLSNKLSTDSPGMLRTETTLKNDPSAATQQSIEFRLESLKRLLDRGLITQEDFERKKSNLLGTL
jgi:hypothetical protein